VVRGVLVDTETGGLRDRKTYLPSPMLRLVLRLLERTIRYAQVQELVTRHVPVPPHSSPPETQKRAHHMVDPH
jgi:hypothetical protein